MKDIQIFKIKAKTGFASYVFEGTEDIMFDMASQGYTYKGLVPVKIEAYGGISEYNLIFEKEV